MLINSIFTLYCILVPFVLFTLIRISWWSNWISFYVRLQNCKKWLLAVSVCLSICSSGRLSTWNNLAPSGWVFMEFYIWVFFKNLSRKLKFQVSLKYDLSTFLIISRSVLLSMRNVSDKACRENENMHFMFSNFFKKSCHLWGNVDKYVRERQAKSDNWEWCMHIACWIPKVTSTHSGY